MASAPCAFTPYTGREFMVDEPVHQFQPGTDRVGAGLLGAMQPPIVRHRLMDRVGRPVVIGSLVERQIVTVEPLDH